MTPSYRIVLRAGPTPGKTFPLDKPEVFIGRDLSNDIVINDPEISRRHSHLVLKNGVYLLEDMGSTNGTSVNGQRLAGLSELHPGDVITLGERVTLAFEAVQPMGDATLTADSSDRTVQGAGISPSFIPAPYPPPAYESPAPQARPPVTPPVITPAQPAASPSDQATFQPISPAAIPSYQAPPVRPPQLGYQPVSPVQQPTYQPPSPAQQSSYQPVSPIPSPYQPMPAPPPPAFEQAPASFAGQVPFSPGAEPFETQRKPVTWPYFVVIGLLLLIILVLVIDDFKLWCPLFGWC